MKRNIITIGALLFLSAVLFSCSKSSDNNPENDLTLKQSLQEKTINLSNAVTKITNSKGFEILTMKDTTTLASATKQGNNTKSSVNITLEDVKGVYEYQSTIPETSKTKADSKRKFTKTADSEEFIIKLPKEKVNNPWQLNAEEETNDSLVNNFVVTTSDYNYSFSADKELKFNNLLNSSIEVEGETIGKLFVNSSIESAINSKYESKFSFSDEYSVGIEFLNDSVLSYAYNLKMGDDVLFMEKVELNKEDSVGQKSLEYTLSIGIIKIVKNSESENYQVYRDGNLEEGAVIEVINENTQTEESNLAFCKNNIDLKVTFADETNVVLSELLGQDTLDKMTEIFNCMYDMYFVDHIVNKVAQETYYINQYGN